MFKEFSAQDAIDADVVIATEAKDGFAEGALQYEASFFVGAPATDVFFHVLSLDTIKIQFQEAVADHESGSFGAIALTLGGGINDDIEFSGLIECIDIFEANKTNQAIIA